MDLGKVSMQVKPADYIIFVFFVCVYSFVLFWADFSSYIVLFVAFSRLTLCTLPGCHVGIVVLSFLLFSTPWRTAM